MLEIGKPADFDGQEVPTDPGSIYSKTRVTPSYTTARQRICATGLGVIL